MFSIFDNLQFNLIHEIPVGYKNGVIVTKKVKAMKIDLDNDIFGTFSLEFLDNLPPYYKVQIGNTFYNKRPSEFVYDYLNQSSDYRTNLDPIVYDDIYIYRDIFI